jgi:hypothetical protein
MINIIYRSKNGNILGGSTFEQSTQYIWLSTSRTVWDAQVYTQDRNRTAGDDPLR